MTSQNMVVMKSILRSFELVFRLKVDFHKSRFGGCGVEREVVERFVKYLNCRVLSFSFVYLEIPIGVNPTRLETWESIIAKFKKNLTSWKQKHFSFAERICLINSVLYISCRLVRKGERKFLG